MNKQDVSPFSHIFGVCRKFFFYNSPKKQFASRKTIIYDIDFGMCCGAAGFPLTLNNFQTFLHPHQRREFCISSCTGDTIREKLVTVKTEKKGFSSLLKDKNKKGSGFYLVVGDRGLPVVGELHQRADISAKV